MMTGQTTQTAALIERYRALLETDGTPLPLPVTGSSMLPFLSPGRDSVLLARPNRRLRRGDMALYRREGGGYVLHRIVACQRDGGFAMAGDAQQLVERGIRRDQIVAVVCAAVRKGRCQGPGCFWWEFFARVWPRVLPLRGGLCRAYGVLSRFRRGQK